MKLKKKSAAYKKGGKVMAAIKKYNVGGKMSNSEDTYSARIEALKAKIREEKDPAAKAVLLQELAELRKLAKKDGAQRQGDSMKESRAKKAEKAGDKGRAIRIRSSKQIQGQGEVGK